MKIRGTLLWKLLRSFLVLSALQVALIILIGHLLGIYRSGYDNSYHFFRNNLEIRVEMLEKTFRTATRDLSHYGRESSLYVNRVMQERGVRAEELVQGGPLLDEIMEELAGELVDYLLTHDEVQGAFFLFGQEPLAYGGAAIPGVYIRKDTVSALDDMSWESWYLVAGPPRIAQQLGMRYDHLWDRDFIVDGGGEAADFFNVPFAHATQTGQASYYISKLFRLREESDAVTTVTVPLLDNQGKPYGMLGVSFPMGTTLGNLSSLSLSNVTRGFYAMTDVGDIGFERAFIASNSLGDLYRQQQPLIWKIVDDNYGIVRFSAPGTTLEPMLATAKELALYDASSPYREQGYRLVAFASEAELLSSADTFQLFTGIFLASFLLISIAAIVLMSIGISKPVIRLARSVRQIDAHHKVKLEPTGIREIDLLLGALESFSEKLRQSAMRFSKIIDLLEKPIGGFEEDDQEGQVYITESIRRIFDIPGDGGYSLSSGEWEMVKAMLSREGMEEYPDTYRCRREGMGERYLQLTTRQEQGKTLGIVMDVTNEVLEKNKLRTERDTDALTGLANRRSFRQQVEKHLKEMPKDRVGAMVFIDLDSLKVLNDTYGHQVGDRYLKATARALLDFAPEHAVSARLSGDEFALFIYDGRPKEELKKVLEELFYALWNTCIQLPDETHRFLAFSAGISWCPAHGETYATLLKHADFAMYQVKHSTKNNYCEFSPRLLAGGSETHR